MVFVFIAFLRIYQRVQRDRRLQFIGLLMNDHSPLARFEAQKEPDRPRTKSGADLFWAILGTLLIHAMLIALVLSPSVLPPVTNQVSTMKYFWLSPFFQMDSGSMGAEPASSPPLPPPPPPSPPSAPDEIPPIAAAKKSEPDPATKLPTMPEERVPEAHTELEAADAELLIAARAERPIQQMTSPPETVHAKRPPSPPIAEIGEAQLEEEANAERMRFQKAEQERLEKEEIDRIKAEQKRHDREEAVRTAEKERLQKERERSTREEARRSEEQQRLAREKALQEQREAAIARQAEAERQARQQAELERARQERARAEKQAQESAAQEQKAREEARRASEEARVAREKALQEKLAREREESERQRAEKGSFRKTGQRSCRKGAKRP